jgi:FkbM family methyltransferase
MGPTSQHSAAPRGRPLGSTLGKRMRPYAAHPIMLAEMADWRSVGAYARLLRGRRSRQRDGARGDGRSSTVVRLRLRSLDGHAVTVRPRSSDLWALREALVGRYHLPPPDVRAQDLRLIWDLGSNIGLTIAHLAARYPRARIVGVELDGRNAGLCRENVSPWADRCRVVEGAVWAEEGEVTYLSEPGNELATRAVHATGHTTATTRSAPAITLDSLLAEHTDDTWVDFVKMDIEGAEREVLVNNTAWARRVRSINVEVHPPYSPADCERDLARLGFRTAIAGAGSCGPVYGVRHD